MSSPNKRPRHLNLYQDPEEDNYTIDNNEHVNQMFNLYHSVENEIDLFIKANNLKEGDSIRYYENDNDEYHSSNFIEYIIEKDYNGNVFAVKKNDLKQGGKNKRRRENMQQRKTNRVRKSTHRVRKTLRRRR
jgi:hypothetical protein